MDLRFGPFGPLCSFVHRQMPRRLMLNLLPDLSATSVLTVN
jgi:hypothetical protein